MSLIELVIPPREADIGGLAVRRLLPYYKRRMVGPFIFLDHMGPKSFDAAAGIDVKPHPHIGLSTLTYLFSGNIMHRDSIGSVQEISAGAVNWMTAGRGIAHSERTTAHERSIPHDLHGLQSWIALPKECEEQPPEFSHYAADKLPVFDIKGVNVKLIAGSAYGHEAPVKIYSPLFYAEVHMQPGQSLKMPGGYRDAAIYVVGGRLRIGDTEVEPHTMPIFLPNDAAAIEALTPAHIMLMGGDPLSEPRFIWWNFVSSSQERLEQAKADWQENRFDPIPGEHEFVPLPKGP